MAHLPKPTRKPSEIADEILNFNLRPDEPHLRRSRLLRDVLREAITEHTINISNDLVSPNSIEENDFHTEEERHLIKSLKSREEILSEIFKKSQDIEVFADILAILNDIAAKRPLSWGAKTFTLKYLFPSSTSSQINKISRVQRCLEEYAATEFEESASPTEYMQLEAERIANGNSEQKEASISEQRAAHTKESRALQKEAELFKAKVIPLFTELQHTMDRGIAP